jgi:tetratricopeptide (TPR) repeat protein
MPNASIRVTEITLPHPFESPSNPGAWRAQAVIETTKGVGTLEFQPRTPKRGTHAGQPLIAHFRLWCGITALDAWAREEQVASYFGISAALGSLIDRRISALNQAEVRDAEESLGKTPESARVAWNTFMSRPPFEIVSADVPVRRTDLAEALASWRLGRPQLLRTPGNPKVYIHIQGRKNSIRDCADVLSEIITLARLTKAVSLSDRLRVLPMTTPDNIEKELLRLVFKLDQPGRYIDSLNPRASSGEYEFTSKLLAVLIDAQKVLPRLTRAGAYELAARIDMDHKTDNKSLERSNQYAQEAVALYRSAGDYEEAIRSKYILVVNLKNQQHPKQALDALADVAIMLSGLNKPSEDDRIRIYWSRMHSYRWDLEVMLGRTKDASESYAKSLALLPDNSYLRWFHEAWRQRDAGQFDTALESEEKAMRLLQHVGRDYVECDKFLSPVILLPRHLHLKASILAKLGKREEAMTYFHKSQMEALKHGIYRQVVRAEKVMRAMLGP